MTKAISQREKFQYSNIIQFAIFLYLLNAVAKYFLPSVLTKALPIIAVLIVYIRKKEPLKISISKLDMPMLAFFGIWALGCFYSTDMGKGFGFVLSSSVALFFGMLIWQYKLNEAFIMKFLAAASIILVSFVIIQPFLPELISNITKLFSYSSVDYYNMSEWAKKDMYSGLFPDRAPAAFFGCILIGIGIYYLFRNRKMNTSIAKRLFGLVFIAIGAYGILLTAKRGLLIGALVAVFVTYLVYKRANQKPIIKICVAVAIIGLIVYILAMNLEAAQVIISRFAENEDFYTGRLDIYSGLYAAIEASPIIGNGTASASDILGIGGHNIYLTVFMENGIIGVSVFVFALLYNLFYTIKDALTYGKNGWKNELPFLFFSLYNQVFFISYGFSGNPLYDNYIFYFYLFALLITKNLEYRYKTNT